MPSHPNAGKFFSPTSPNSKSGLTFYVALGEGDGTPSSASYGHVIEVSYTVGSRVFVGDYPNDSAIANRMTTDTITIIEVLPGLRG